MPRAKKETPIANVDTDVPVVRSVSQIQTLVERFRAREFRTVYDDDGNPSAVRFTITDPHLSTSTDDALFTVELSAPCGAIMRELRSRARYDVTPDRARRIEDQARRVAWRQLHDIVRALLMGVHAGLFTIGEAFMANLIVTNAAGGEQRLGTALTDAGVLTPHRGRLLLGSGK